MENYQTEKFKVGLIIAKAQPFHNGHVRIISDALMQCNEVIVVFLNYDTAFFDYNFNQQSSREIFGTNKRIAYYGLRTEYLNGVSTIKEVILKVLEKLDEAGYNKPEYFFTHYDDWVEPAKECMLWTTRISTLPDTDSATIYNSVISKTDYWKDKVPYALVDKTEMYILTKFKELEGN